MYEQVWKLELLQFMTLFGESSSLVNIRVCVNIQACGTDMLDVWTSVKTRTASVYGVIRWSFEFGEQLQFMSLLRT